MIPGLDDVAVTVLLGARKELAARGHTKRVYADRRGVCAIGAIAQTTCGRPYPPMASSGATLDQANRYRAGVRALLTWVVSTTDHTDVSRWNDSHTQAEVEAGLLDAARAHPAYHSEVHDGLI